jgi:tripartite-type tricarboxylate transporter receptor subunit TctC
MPTLAEVPTIEEATGYKPFDVRTWFGLAAPAGVPGSIVTRLNTEVRRALADSGVRAKLEQIGGAVSPSSPQEFRDRIAREWQMWTKVVDDIKLPRQ